MRPDAAGSAQRRRPRDRRAHILAAAAARFRADGYHQVSMAGIAADVGIGASALYRHFTGKQELLLAVLDQRMGAVEALTASGRPGPDVVADLAVHALEHGELGVLWEREAGHLAPEVHRVLRHRLRAVAARVGPADGTAEGDLRSWAALSVVASPSYHRRGHDPDLVRRLLVRAADAVIAVPLPDVAVGARTRGPGGARLAPVSRREALLAAAIRLFSARSYPAVSLDDIGGAAGMAGPSVYRHFASKIEVLEAALGRGNEALWLGLHAALADARDERDALARLAERYTAFTVDNPGLVDILVSELVHLPEERHATLRRAQREYLGEWSALLTAIAPDAGPEAAEITVRTALGVANGLARIHHLRTRPGHAERVTALVTAVLRSGAP